MHCKWAGYLKLLIVLLSVNSLFSRDSKYAFPEKYDMEYLLDVWMGTLYWDWQRDFNNWNSGMQVSMGCFSMQEFYVNTDLKIERNLWEDLNFKFRYQKEELIDAVEENREFTLFWQFKSGPRVAMHLYPSFIKRESDNGYSIGWHKKNIDIDAGLIVNDFDNNWSYSEDKDGKQKFYKSYPLTYFMETKYRHAENIHSTFSFYYTRQSKAEYKIIEKPDSTYYEAVKKVRLKGYHLYQPQDHIAIGLREFYRFDYDEEYDHKDADKNLFFKRETVIIEPMFYYIFKKPNLWIGASCQILNEILYRKETQNIKRENLLPTISINHHLFWKLDMNTTYLRSDVNFENYGMDGRSDGVQNRIISAIEFPFNNGARFQFRKGWELDRGDDMWGPGFFLYDKIHCHLIVQF
ncbi:MAG: hypothetical protein JXA60_07450 [Candidatus Coatesbacteria bacterium]|nr:hypothetical protein [Candidatus Coatesbacteria bacterium]